MKRVLVTGAGGPAGVNFINSLRDAPEKLYLVGADINKYHLGWAKTDKKYLVPPFDHPEYIGKLNELIGREKIEFVHAQPDGEVRLLSENREKIKARLYLPKKETVRNCQDKFASGKIWKEKGLPLVETIYIQNLKDLERIEEIFGYPYWVRASVGYSSRGSTLVENKKTAQAWIEYWVSKGTEWRFIAQAYLPGKIIAFQSLWKDGELVTSQARERIEYLYAYLAPSGITNTPTIAKTIQREDVNEMATKCILAIDEKATGIFCVDLRENEKQEPIPTEINAGRFFTTSYFFTKAGINMPYYYVKLAYEEKIPKLPQYNALPEGLYWCRHIDCPAILGKEEDWECSKI